MPRPGPGFAFSIVCDLGFAVGLVTHDVPKIGALVWIAGPTFDDEPTLEGVRQISSWRWPVFFPLGPAVRRKIVNPIGIVPVPLELQSEPLMRSRNGRGGWTLVRFVNGASVPSGVATDPELPRYRVVNDTALKEMIVSRWKPADVW
ncbi:MAG: hypothetical protein QOF28_761 [Actinomycetota bacterium]|nr:hypothetical protein [Actinomycetota bacterium]